MARYIMKPNGPDRWVIRHARRNVGSVRKTEGGTAYVGRIGQHEAQGSTALTAFYEVTARAMGFASYAALRAHNAQVRRNNRMQRANIRSRLGLLDHMARVARNSSRPEPGPVDDEPYELEIRHIEGGQP